MTEPRAVPDTLAGGSTTNPAGAGVRVRYTVGGEVVVLELQGEPMAVNEAVFKRMFPGRAGKPDERFDAMMKARKERAT